METLTKFQRGQSESQDFSLDHVALKAEQTSGFAGGVVVVGVRPFVIDKPGPAASTAIVLEHQQPAKEAVTKAVSNSWVGRHSFLPRRVASMQTLLFRALGRIGHAISVGLSLLAENAMLMASLVASLILAVGGPFLSSAIFLQHACSVVLAVTRELLRRPVRFALACVSEECGPFLWSMFGFRLHNLIVSPNAG